MKRLPLPAAILLLLTLTGTSVPPRADAATGVRLCLEPNDFVRYAIETVRREDSRYPEPPQRGQIDDVAGFQGSEVDASGRRVRRPTHDLQMLYVPYVFWLPKGARPGQRQRIREVLPQTWRMAPIQAVGWIERRAGAGPDPKTSMMVAGHVEFRPGPSEPQVRGHSYRSLVQGALTWTAQVDLERGLITSAAYTLRWKSHRATDDRPDSVAFMDPDARTFETQVRLKLDRVLTYRYPDFQKDVDGAVERGLAFLLAAQRPEGAWRSPRDIGITALVLLTLLDGGIDPEHAAIRRGFDWLLGKQPWSGTQTRQNTYSTGVAMMALEARRVPASERAARQRGANPAVGPRALKTNEQAFMQKAVQILLAAAERRPAEGPPVSGRAHPFRWHYDLEPGPESLEPRGWDNSNTQYAVLGLESAARCGIKIPRAAWLGIAQHFLDVQVGDGPAPRAFTLARATGQPAKAQETRRGGHRYGKSKDRQYAPFIRTARSRGWHYHVPAHPGPGISPSRLCYGSMTATGIGSLAIARARLAETKRRSDRAVLRQIDQAIIDGFVSLDDMFTVWAHPQYEGWYLYYMYALERAGMLTGIQTFGGHDWYWEGAVQLLSRQRSEPRSRGKHTSWMYHMNEVGSTCFAILFLKRGTIPVVTPR